MTAFNWEYVRGAPIKFTRICALYSLNAVLLTLRRLVSPASSLPTNYVTALKSLLLKIFFLKDYKFIYSTPPAAFAASRQITGQGWHAYEVDCNPNLALSDYDAVVLYFHGGGYAIGEPMQYYETFKRWQRKAAQLGTRLAIVSLRYPLSTEQPYPAQRNAALAAYQHLIQHEHVSPSKIILCGDSAGGNLVASLLVYLRDHDDIPRPACSVMISPWLDPSLSKTAKSPFAGVDFVYGDGTCEGTRGMAQLIAGKDHSPSDPEISLARSTDLKSIPPHLCCYGTAEVYQEDSKMWIAQCLADGVDVTEYSGKGAVHTFVLGGLTADAKLEEEADGVFLDYIIKHLALNRS
ncbi:hypothetical protein AYO21_01761 [Fonsecaea monophora]|uniref:Alpha/beta hydrolase fold-3 domain-containing protein n=1 Tax=Fonsecaea monophora TaxID=254056 RepID=A0A177FL92_9EURO|nr:hypothetical protein AYO21_01761 [Fonsecaea monophora]KAH0836928.1 alpha/beta hydrolase domain-containing protein [Fonsecaea pedrosoi]OAG43909.1 hypothetical protein AYO21_01761 [Fonsecaea monophora]